MFKFSTKSHPTRDFYLITTRLGRYYYLKAKLFFYAKGDFATKW